MTPSLCARIPGIFLAAFLTIVSGSAAADARELNPAEKWVVEMVTAGEVADLDAALNADQIKKFPDKKDRKLGAKFLEDLLAGMLPGIKPHRNGVRIRWAIIDDRIDLRNAQIPWEVWLEHCQFGRGASFARVTFAGAVSFMDSTFNVDADFSGMKVGQAASFKRASFEGPVNFDAIDIASNFVAEGAQFKSKEQEPYFSRMKVGRNAYFTKAVFEGPVNFGEIDIAKTFVAEEAQFKNNEQVAYFDGMKVGDIANFRKAVFEGPVNFVAVDIATDFQAEGAQFKNKQHEARFSTMKVGGAFFQKAVFEGPANFEYASVGRNFEAAEMHFNDKEQGASFNSMKVGDSAIFTKTVFEGPVDFVAVDIARYFQAQEAEFRNNERKANFCGMKIGDIANFDKAVFEGPVSFADSSFLDLMIRGTNAGAAAVPKLDLSRASIKRQLSIRKISIHDLVGPSLHVEGPADFTDVIVEQSADLSDGNFATLDLSRSSWPKDGKNGGTFRMRGMNYKYLHADANVSKSHDALLKLADQSGFAADVYGNLEAFFVRQGYSAHADRAFIAGKRRERNEVLHGIRSFGSLLLDGLVGYGRRPWQTGIPCALLIALGCFLFSPRKMEQQKPEDAPRIYNPFWYSLGLFLPIVNLQSDAVWKPKNHCRFLRHYVRIHILLGWIFIPIVLAALTGLIK
jgi:uncharacterized protein YjbI with pentapeptide repeats